MESKLIHRKWFLYLTEFFAGMSVMAVELGASRLMAPYFSSSQIVWTVIIGVIMIAMAIMCNPRLIIADEPTTALDVTIQAQILELMKDLQKKISTSIIMITHDLGIVSDLCDRVNVMYGSQIMESGTVDDLFYRTSHPYTRGLLRCLPESVQNLEDKRLHPIMGSPVDLMMLPAGCAFSARCDDCMKLCLNRRPELFEVNPGHTSRCWLTALENAAKEVQA